MRGSRAPLYALVVLSFSIALFAPWSGTSLGSPGGVWAQPPVYEGFGASTPGGSAGTVVHVTNLNDTGAGSFRAAVAAGNRTVVFDVGGTIELASAVYVGGAFITIDGFTAPYPGITLHGGALVIRGNQGAHDVIVRGLRVRDAPLDGFQVAYGAYNVVLDHVSVSGSGDGNIDITEDSHDVTVSWSILAVPASHKNMLIKYGAHRLSVHHNLFAHSEQRNPIVSTNDAGTPATGTTIDIRNNVIWDWGFGTGILIFKGAIANVVANYTFSPGSSHLDQSQGVVVCNLDCDGDFTAHSLAYVIDNLSGGALTVDMNAEGNVLDPFPAPTVTPQNAYAAAQSVLAQAGVRPLDSVDEQILAGIVLPAPPAGTNLSVSFLSVGTAGSALTITDRTTNGSPQAAGESTTRFFLSVDPGLDGADIHLGSRSVEPLDPYASSVGSLTVPFPPGIDAGTYFVISRADADGQVTETNEADNITVRTVALLFPDLMVSALSAPAAVAPGSSIAVSDTTRNQATVGAAIVTATRFFLSTDAILDAGDLALGSRTVPALAGGTTRYYLSSTPAGGANDVMIGVRTVPALAAGAQSSGSASVTIPASTSSGTHFIIARADGAAVVDEAVEINNARAHAIEIGMDLSVASLSAASWTSAGATLMVSDTTKNKGTGTAPASTTVFFLSTSAVLTADAVMIGSRDVGPLANGAISSWITPALVPSGLAGDFYIIALANAGPGMGGDSNNVRSKAIRVGPDLYVSGLTAPVQAKAGAGITVTDTTRNGASVEAPTSSITRYYVSTQSILNGQALPIGERVVPPLPAGHNHAQAKAVTLPGGLPPGAYFIIAESDAGHAVLEYVETNNTRSRAITILP